MSKKLIAGAGVVASFAIALAPLATFADQATNASDQHADELVVTVLPSCTFGSASKSTDPYAGGITHDNSQGDYGENAADSSYAAGGKISATAWNTATGTAEAASGTDEGGHTANDIASTGYGINGEGGVLSTNENSSEHTVHRSMLAGTTTDTFAQTTMWVVCNNGDGYSITATANALTDGAQNNAKEIIVANDYSAAKSGYTLKTLAASENGMTTENAAAAAYNDTRIAYKNGVSAEAGDSLTVTYGMGIASSQEADTYAGKVTYKLYKGVNATQNNGD